MLIILPDAVDYVLDDCFQLISLFFLTIGRNNEAPAVYVFSHSTVLGKYSAADFLQLLVNIDDQGTQLTLEWRDMDCH